MSNVIKFPEKKDGDLFEYFHGVHSLGIKTKNENLKLTKWGCDEDMFSLGINVFNREELAQFLWAAAYYLDSEKRYMPEGDLVGINYDD